MKRNHILLTASVFLGIILTNCTKSTKITDSKKPISIEKSLNELEYVPYNENEPFNKEVFASIAEFHN